MTVKRNVNLKTKLSIYLLGLMAALLIVAGCGDETDTPDTEAPVITLNGNSTVSLQVGDGYTEAGATAYDNKDGNISSRITISGNVDTSIENDYTLTYRVTDTAGNEATPVTRIVSVSHSPSVIVIDSETLTSGDQGTAYTFRFEASGNSSPVTWSLILGQLPSGLTLDASGELSGTPTESGRFDLTVQAFESPESATQKDFVLVINTSSQGNGEKSILFLHHSTGGGVYSTGGVPQWIAEYNATNGTNYSISERDYPDTPYPWNNYPYDYWNLWVTEDEAGNPRTPSCNSRELGIECLDSLAASYDVIIFKHCFPGSDIGADSGNPVISSSSKRIENYKLQYRALRKEMDRYPDTIFIVWTLAPLHREATTPENAARAKAFVDWVNNDFLTEDGSSHPNIHIFDFWGIVAEGQINPANGEVNTLKYDYEISHSSNDSHPNTLANETAGPIFAQGIVDAIGN